MSKTDTNKDLVGRYSLAYMRSDSPLTDSDRMRNRLFALLSRIGIPGDLYDRIREETGVKVFDYEVFFLNAGIQDVLDALTIAFDEMVARRFESYRSDNPQKWLQGVQRIFDELNMAYKINARGEVRMRIDAEFEKNRAATIVALSETRYANVLAQFEDGVSKLLSVPTDAKGAVRGVFYAAEGLFKLMFPNEPRLVAGKVDERLSPFLSRAYGDNDLRASQKILNSFKDWIDAAHCYRHEEGKEEVSQPPIEIAIELTAQGASFIRWLGVLDAKARQD